MCSPGILRVTYLLYVVQLRYYNKVVEGVYTLEKGTYFIMRVLSAIIKGTVNIKL